MSSESPNAESNGSTFLNSSKKRRTPGACDHCKKKKIRCDSAEMLGNRCSNCVQLSLECTHKEVVKTLGSAKGYVESLELRLEKMEGLLGKLLPGVDLSQEIDGLDKTETPPKLPALPRNDGDILEEELIGKLKRLHVDPPQGRFFGKSSGYQLVQTALDIRSEYVGKDSKFWSSNLGSQRAEFWFSPPWHPSRLDWEKPPTYIFPDDDLIPPLVDAYFAHINIYLPLFHRPWFEKSVINGSRYLEDPRVLYPGTASFHSAGWKWYEQVEIIRKSFIRPPLLYELQNHALSVLFTQSTETPQGCWTQIGMALRMAQEVGAHRHRTLKAPTAEDEHWKRAFWVLMCLDRLISSFSGRQCVLQEEDYDVEPPIECDDEYWDHPDPALNFQQPAGKPSTITYFNCYIKLLDILAYVMRVVYPVRKTSRSIVQGAFYLDQQIIVDLDSAMNRWMDSVPDHLRWNPGCENKLFVKQSASLYATYYHLQIFTHRPFIPSFRNPSPTTLPSLAICTNAARSCCHVLDTQDESELPLPGIQPTIFTAAVVLLLNIWSGKRSGAVSYPRREIEDVQRCINILKALERKWCSAGRYLDILMDLASAGDMSFASHSPRDSTPRNEHLRDSTPIRATQTDSSWQFGTSNAMMPSSMKILSVHDFTTSQPLKFELPMYSNELGRLPVYGQFGFSESYKRPRREPFQKDFSLWGASHGSDPLTDNATPATNPNFPRLNFFMGSESDAQVQEWNPYDTYESCGNTDPAFMSGKPHEDFTVPMMDSDTLAMLSATPTGFELNEWGTYITSVNQMTHGPETCMNRWCQ